MPLETKSAGRRGQKRIPRANLPTITVAAASGRLLPRRRKIPPLLRGKTARRRFPNTAGGDAGCWTQGAGRENAFSASGRRWRMSQSSIIGAFRGNFALNVFATVPKVANTTKWEKREPFLTSKSEQSTMWDGWMIYVRKIAEWTIDAPV